MVETFISKAGQGKSACMLIEAAKQSGKSVAFISLEMTTKEIMQRLKLIKPTTNNFRVFSPREGEAKFCFRRDEKTLSSWLMDKLSQLAEDFDIICIDAVENSVNGYLKKSDYERLNKACFGGFMSQCESLWVSQHINDKLAYGENYMESIVAVESAEIEGLVKVKQICRKIEHPLLPNTFLIESVDLVKKEVHAYNLSNLFKNK